MFIYHLRRFKSYATKTKDELVALGFPSFTIEDFHDVVSFYHLKLCCKVH